MLWVKSFHIIFMVTWFAGLFYLPRLFVYHAEATDEISLRRFETMERRLFIIMTIGAVGTLVFGLWLLFGWMTALASAGWLHAKLLLVLGMIGYHVWLYRLTRQLATGQANHSPRFYRLINEAPALFLISIVILVVVRPF